MISEAMELAASETADAAELTTSETVLPEEDSEETSETSDDAPDSEPAPLSLEASLPAVSSGPETGSSVSAASPVISPSGISEEVSELSDIASLEELLCEETEEEMLEPAEEDTEELEVSFLLLQPIIEIARAAVRAIKSVFFMILFASIWEASPFLNLNNYVLCSSQKLSI